jgi:hypothetical protein
MTDKFWQWMEKKGYGDAGNVSKGFYYLTKDGLFWKPTKQMLIGYMIEYLIQKDFLYEVGKNICGSTDIDEIYEDLEHNINELEEHKDLY